MKLETNYTIGGVVVEDTGKRLGDLVIYTPKVDGDDLTLYFVNREGNLVGKMEVEAEMSQGCGYISDWNVA